MAEHHGQPSQTEEGGVEHERENRRKGPGQGNFGGGNGYIPGEGPHGRAHIRPVGRRGEEDSEGG